MVVPRLRLATGVPRMISHSISETAMRILPPSFTLYVVWTVIPSG